jgi:hypothetical protein
MDQLTSNTAMFRGLIPEGNPRFAAGDCAASSGAYQGSDKNI